MFAPLLATLSLLVVTSSVSSEQLSQGQLLRWFVAPDGDDGWDGDTPGRTGPSGPFRTLRRAFDEVRAVKRANRGSLPAAALIELVPGTHFLDEPLLLTPEDSGDRGSRRVFVVQAEGPDVERAVAAGREPRAPRAIVSGGRRITGWRRERSDGRELFVADVPEARGGGWRFRQLFVNGERRTRARHPDRGYLAVAALDDADGAKPWNEGVSSFRFAPGDLDLLRGASAADLTVMCRWVESHVRVERVDFEGAVVKLREPTVFKLDPGDPYYLDGARAFLDAPGEWFLDDEHGRLLVVPKPGEDLTDPATEVIAPRLERLLVLTGRFEPDRAEEAASRLPLHPSEEQSSLQRSVHGVTFEGIAFAHIEWWFPPPADAASARQSGFPQAAVGVPGAIEAIGARDCRFERCTVQHVGGYAIELGRGCQGNVLVDCELSDLGGGGVKIGTTSIATSGATRASGNVVTGCRIRDGGRIFHSAIGVWIGQSPANRIAENEISDFYYTGISLGWTWGYGPADAASQVIDGNHVHHIGRRTDGDGPILSDLAAIYTLGAHAGTEISKNWFHDVAAFRYGGWGIYFDEGTSEIVARDNLVVRTTHGGFHQHYGRENVVERNVFAYGRDAQIQRSRCEPHSSFRFRSNVVLFDRGALFAGDLSDGHFDFERNVYWREDGGAIDFAGRSFEDWQASGFDVGAQIVDPRFSAPSDDDWSLTEDSPARGLLGRQVFVPPLYDVPWRIPWARAVERPRNR